MAKHNRGDLQQMQSLPLEAKIIMTEQRIRVWVDAWKRYEIVNKKTGRNAFELDRPTSQPLSFWTEQDILQYIATRGIRIAEAYGEVEYDGKKYKTTKTDRTGCVFCLFGITRDKERIARLQINDPQLADYVLRGGGVRKGRILEAEQNRIRLLVCNRVA